MTAAELTSPTTQEFRAFCLALYGPEWQTPLARALGVARRTVQRWAAGDVAVPETAWAAIQKIAGIDQRGLPTWPRDEWIIGDGPPMDETGGTRREYIVHAMRPRFIARVLDADPATDEPAEGEAEADTLTGVVYRAGPGTLLCEIVWIDPPPPGDKLTALLEAAADAIEDHI